MRRRVVLGLIVVIGILVVGYLIYRSAFTAAPSTSTGRNQQGGAQSVGVATVGRGDIRVVLNALGTVTPIATITVVTQIDGQLMSVPFTEGQIVHKGDTLAQIDDRPGMGQAARSKKSTGDGGDPGAGGNRPIGKPVPARPLFEHVFEIAERQRQQHHSRIIGAAQQ